MPVRRIFGDHGRGACVFAAGGEPLDQFEQDEQDRCQGTDGRIAGQEADQQGGCRHAQQCKGQDALAADLVAQLAQDHATQGSGDEGDSEDTQ